MKVMKFKSVQGGPWTPQHPNAKPGDTGRVVTIQIAAIPDDVSMPIVTLRLNGATLSPGQYTYDWADLAAVKDTQIWVRVSPDLKAWCEEQAAEDGRSLSRWIAHQLELMRKIFI